MTIRHEATVANYARHHAEMWAMLENLKEFIETLPAPDEDGNLHNIDYGYTGDVARIHQLFKDASDIAYEMSE